MDRRSFLQVSVPASLGLASGIPKRPQPEPSPSWTLTNNRLKIVLSEETKGGLSAITDLQSVRNFMAIPVPLYRLVLVQKGKDPLEVSSQDAESLKVDRTSAGRGETLSLTYGRHRSLDISVICSVSLD